MNNSQKKILSVVIPTYNRKKELKALLDSLAVQKFDRSELDITVVDDGSTDGTAALVKKFQKLAIKYIRQENSGPAAARNKGYRNTTGAFIGFLDSDVIADKKYLKNAVDYLKKHRGLDCIEGRTLSKSDGVKPSYFTHSVENTTGGQYMTCNIIYSRRIMDKVEGFDERYNNPHVREDTDLAFAAMKAGAEFAYAESIVAFHPVYKTSHSILYKTAYHGIHEPLLFRKFPSIYFKKLKWIDGWFVPVYYLGYYAMPFMIVLYPFTKNVLWPVLGLICYVLSYVATIYAQFRKKRLVLSEFFTVCWFFIFLPYVRLFWLAVGFVKHWVMES